MNLGKLLGAGKSFFGGKGSLAYRENKNFYLPKFNTEKNPFASKLKEPVSVAAPEVKKTTTPAAAKTQKIPAPAALGSVRAISWKDKLNPFRTPESGPPALSNAVQTELTLDAVKVIHNDLADADIEIVPVKSRTEASPGSHQAWDFLGERLVKTT